MTFRRASLTDMPGIAALVVNFRKELSQLRGKISTISLDEARQELEGYFKKDYPVFVAEDDVKQIIAYLVCKIDSGVVWAESVFVKAEYRRRKIASSLYEEAEKLARDLGNETVYNWIHPNNDKVIGFLKKRGYSVLNLIELRKPRKNENLRQKLRVGDYEFDY